MEGQVEWEDRFIPREHGGDFDHHGEHQPGGRQASEAPLAAHVYGKCPPPSNWYLDSGVTDWATLATNAERLDCHEAHR